MVTKKKTLTHNKYKDQNGSKPNNASKTKTNNNSVRNNHLQPKSKSGVEDDLFICVTDVLNKRKSLLNSLKTSLQAQEESEVVHNLRSKKYEYLETLKKEINHINNLYSKLQKLFPNTKHVISYAEKELNELDHQINLLNKSREIEEKEFEELETAQKEIEETEYNLEDRNEIIHEKTKNYSSKDDKENTENLNDEEKLNSPKKNSKLGRIQNNLQIIEEKLKYLD